MKSIPKEYNTKETTDQMKSSINLKMNNMHWNVKQGLSQSIMPADIWGIILVCVLYYKQNCIMFLQHNISIWEKELYIYIHKYWITDTTVS